MTVTANRNVVIAFDTWTLAREFRNRGIYVYAREVLGQLREIAAQHGAEVRPFVCNDNEAADFSTTAGFRPVNSALLRHSRLWRYGGGWLSSLRQKPDVIFSPSASTLQIGSRAATVTTIHDVTPVLMPNFAEEKLLRRMRFFLSRAVRTSDRLIAISESCKRDLLRVYGVPESRITVVYSGYDKSLFNTCPPDPQLSKTLLQKHGLERPYVFHHGLMQPRKNLKRLIEAFRLLLSRRRDLDVDLVLAGPLGWRGEELVAAAADSTTRGRVILTGALADDELAAVLKSATMVAIPSLYEGFCLPLVESIACGVPTIAANTSCLPEISGSVLRYFDPESVDEMAASMENVLESDALRKELAMRGAARAQEFDWRKSAEQTLQVLLEAAQAVS
ncbi:MAG TPA: glycosyltransferase family 1 protein [Candidatus Angelobacter sp.]